MRKAVPKTHRLNDRKRESLLSILSIRNFVFVNTTVLRAVDFLPHQLRPQVVYTEYFLHKIQQILWTDCRICRVQETVDHLLIQRSKYSENQRWLKSRLAVLDSGPLNLSKVLGPCSWIPGRHLRMCSWTNRKTLSSPGFQPNIRSNLAVSIYISGLQEGRTKQRGKKREGRFI